MTSEHSRSDFWASTVIPGWCQVMYYAPVSAMIFFGAAVYNWLFEPWYWIVLVHAASTVHAATLVADHFSGKRPATPEAWMSKHSKDR